MFGKGGPTSGMLSMLASMIGVTPEELANQVGSIQNALSETLATMQRIEAKQNLVLDHLGVNYEHLGNGNTGTGSPASGGGSAPALSGPG